MIVYVVLDNSKACYDAGELYHGVFSTLEAAKASFSMYDDQDQAYFEIVKEYI